MKMILSIVLLFTGLHVFGQDSTGVVIHKDQRVDLLLRKQAEVNASIRRASARTAKGYRLLVASTNRREEAIAAKTRIYTNFPELKAYLIYQSPYFKLKAGNFRTRDEANQYQKALNAYFPKGVFVINDTIEITPERENEPNL